MTRSERNCASWSRRRDLRPLVWAANWASTIRSQKSADWLAILRNQAPSDQNARQITPRMITGQPSSVWILSTTGAERREERHDLDDQEQHQERRAEEEQPLGRRAGGVDDRGAQAIEEYRRRERAVEVGEEVDAIQAALDQVAQVVGGQRHGLGGALLAIDDQVADSGQPADQREVEQAEVAVNGVDERRPHAVNQPLGRHLDEPLDDGLDGDLAVLGPGLGIGGSRPTGGGSRPIRPPKSPSRRAARLRRSSPPSRSSRPFRACSSSARSASRRWRSRDSGAGRSRARRG